MQPQLVAWVRAQPLWVRAAAGVLAALVMVYLLPLILVPEAGLDEAEKRLKAENDLRTTLVQAAGGAVLLFGTWRTLHLNREGQITERFTRAIDQLGATGNEKLDVRLGGIYALERIAKESDTDRGPIIEVLTAFLREHARWNPDDSDTRAVTGRDEPGSRIEQRPRLRADFQAAATVLGRNQWSAEHDFDLRQVDLHGANLGGAYLEGANLTDAHLDGANLSGAHLEGAFLVGARLEGAALGEAHLEGAFLVGAHLGDAFLGDAHLEGAALGEAHLEQALLDGAHLEGALLSGAHLEGATLRDADLAGATLIIANLESAYLDGAHLERAFVRGARLKEAHLGGAELSYAHLEEADLRGAYLEGANLRGAYLEGADLRDARLEGANLRGARLEGANLRGARPGGVIGLEHAHLDGAIGLDAWKAATSGREDKNTATRETPADSDDEIAD